MLAAAAATLAALAGCTGGAAEGVPERRATSPTASPTPTPPPQLPRGGRTLFPAYRVVAHYGGSGGPSLGVLGRGAPDQAAAAIEKRAQAYAFAGRPVQPAMELITTVALDAPGPDGTYSSRGNPQAVERYLAAAKRHRMLLVLDFQPGRGDFLGQVRRFERFLREPEVGVALDPEWRMSAGQRPGQVIGSASAASINEVSAYLAALVEKHRLPEKLFVVHQFRPSMLPDRERIVARPGLATVFHADGNGPVTTKKESYARLDLPGAPFRVGFKVFLRADPVLMSPQAVMALRPQPDLVTYQ